MRTNQMPATGYNIVQRILEESKRGAEKSSEGWPSLTSTQVAGLLNQGGFRWPDRNRNGKTELTYEFSTTAPHSNAEFRQVLRERKFEKVVPLSLSQKEFIRKAHQEYADVANVTFTEKASSGGEGHLTYRGYTTGEQVNGVRGFATFPDPLSPYDPGMIWMRRLDQKTKFGDWADDDKTSISDAKWRAVLIHELGHALGIEHPQTYEVPYYVESAKNYTVMSGNSAQLSDTEKSEWPVSLMIDDIAGIQATYGANNSTRKGNTTYGFNSNTDRDHYSLKTSQDKPLFAVWDGGGWDTLDFSEFSQNQTINLNAGSLSSVGGLKNNVGIAQGVTIEEARGGQGKNTLIGNAAFNILRGGRDRDILYGGSGGAHMWGGEGADTFVFDATSSGKPNVVMDFVSGKDKIDLSGMRGQSGRLNLVSKLPLDRSKPQKPNNPTFITKPGDVLVKYDRKKQQTLLRMDTTGDGKMDMQIYVRGKVRPADIIVLGH